MVGKLIKTGEGLYNLLYVTDNTVAEHNEAFDDKLSLKNCQAIERGYDLDEEMCKLVDKKAEQNSQIDLNAYGQGCLDAFQKALEILGDKSFTKDDVEKAIEISRRGSIKEQLDGYGNSTGKKFILDNTSPKKVIQSLQQKEWDVEIVQEQGKDTFGNAELTWYNPKLDADGCLILKRII